ncbi:MULTISPECIES: Hsp20/alpha crystallin family protein [unclassified Chitinophaga]|uniref:Hsp20/alpha crystallin family protein n=1 Tax=unclassified Chitinophaga TaxID=2619133 RepID=UPI0009D34FB0|nr:MULTISPECIES: Hsp20/alpha crystallin family protein [unclassified Chitinophaga]OMP76604.1 heat-shock protein Hsp20 [[Flexibacter] sp. ATCC 35208]WPV64625.1 Hsp20/alpha crystallin family protein [Chitinophaga sp. LS1]
MSKELTKATSILPSAFDDYFKPWKDLFDFNGGKTYTATVPAVNITEEKDQFKLTVAAPGMDKDDFRIDIDNDVLTISAETEETEETPTRQEYNYSSFSRSFRLPVSVVKDKVEAKYKDGILKLYLPKTEEARKANGTKHVVIQ